MGFRFLPKSVTLNDLERRNDRVVCVISPNSLALGTYYVKVIEDTLIHSASFSSWITKPVVHRTTKFQQNRSKKSTLFKEQLAPIVS